MDKAAWFQLAFVIVMLVGVGVLALRVYGRL